MIASFVALLLMGLPQQQQQTRKTTPMLSSSSLEPPEEDARLAAVVIGRRRSDLGELSELSSAAGLRVVEKVVATPARGDEGERRYLDLAAVDELREVAKEYDDIVFVFDDELSPTQQAALERAFQDDEVKPTKKQRAMERQRREMDPGYDKFAEKKRRKGPERTVRVADRTAIVLELFAKRAKTKEGRLQTALATTLYRMPRASMARGLSSSDQLGSTVTERKLTADTDRKTLRKRAALLREKIQNLRRHRARTRQRRSVPVVALVGYTNAGKSSLFNALIGGGSSSSDDDDDDEDQNLVIDDQPFATLDPLTRRLALGEMTALLTDTVGFVSKLPTEVTAAFRATLEEVKAADVLVHVLDASATPDLLKKRALVVDRALDDIFAYDDDDPASETKNPPPRIFFYNKLDAVDPGHADKLRHQAAKLEEATSSSRRRRRLVLGSCETMEGLPELRAALADTLTECLVPVDMAIPHVNASDAASLLTDLRTRGRLISQVSDFHAIHISARAPFDLAARCQPFLVT